MANYAHVENNQIVGVYDILPKNWRNISNFRNLENHVDQLDQYGWKIIQKVPSTHNPITHKIVDNNHYITDGVVYEESVLEEIIQPIIVEPTEEEIQQALADQLTEAWNQIRSQRDQLMLDFEWRYGRYYRNDRNQIEQIDTIEEMDKYMKDLADITQQLDPFNILWPSYKNE